MLQLSENKINILIGLLTVLIILWSLFYGIPSLLLSLFNSILGNLILLLSVILIAIYDPLYAVVAAIGFFLITRVVWLKEGYQNAWSQESINDFVNVEDTKNRNRFFDIGMMQQYTTQKEVDFYLKKGYWPWTEKTMQWYEQEVNKNVYIQSYSKDSLNEARKIYPEKAMMQILAQQSKEGGFLIDGVVVYDPTYTRDGRGSYPYTSGLISLQNRQNASLIKCSSTSNQLTETKNGKTREISYNDLESKIPGFQFINQPCNVCDNLNQNYSCAFKFQGPTTPVWNLLWS